MRSSTDIHPGALIAGKYRVRAILGRNHGLTIDAFHTSFDQRAIIKYLPADQADAREVERFRRESRALSRIASEHVARIIDAGDEPDGAIYIVRQFIEGTDLERHVRTVGPLPLNEAVLYVLQASEAVAEAHANGIIVRDLEPSHLFLTARTGGAPMIKVTDFGTAKLVAVAQDASGEVTGTAMFSLTPYASPELIRKARNVDVRTDVWSLGTILYEMLAGRPAFQGEAAALMLQITRDAPMPLSMFRSDVPQDLENVIGWALAKDADSRFRNVHAFAHALLPFAPPEGHLLVERIGQITATAREKRASGSVPPPSSPGSVPRAVPPPTGSGSSPPAAWPGATNPAPIPVAARLPTGVANLPVDDDAETSIIPGSYDPSRPYPFAGGGSPAAGQVPAARASSPTAGQVPAPRASSPMAASPPVEPPVESMPPAQVPPTMPPVGEPAAPASAAAAPNDQNRMLRVLLAFCALGLVAAVVLAVLLLIKQSGSSEVATTDESGATSSTAIAVAVPTTPAEAPSAAASEQAPAPSASESASAAASASAAPSASAAAPEASAAASSDPDKPSGTSKPPPAPRPTIATGTLVAVSVGKPCSFAVNGSGKGRSMSIRLKLRAGTYSVTCKPAGGAPKAKSVRVRPGETAMTMFKH